MLWVIILAVVIIVPIALISTLSGDRRGGSLGARAEYEKLQRSDPNHPLAKVGQNEFERAFLQAQAQDFKAGCAGSAMTIVAVPLAPLAGLIVGYLTDEPTMGVVVALAIFAFAVYRLVIAWRDTRKFFQPPTRDEIAARLGIDGRGEDR